MATDEGKVTIGDIAQALGISKTTVSRAISGKGRIGAETVKRVKEYIEEHDYVPNPMAKGLANSKTYNIAMVMPGDTNMTDLPFFQKCMIGISSEAAKQDYDVMLTLIYDNDISGLERIVRNQKVDGIILTRTMVDDAAIDYLRNSQIPFVVVGSCKFDDVCQVDNDHINACKELTSFIILKGVKRIALIGGTTAQVVNRTRLEGYKKAFDENKIKYDADNVYMDSESVTGIHRAVDEVLRKSVDCIICTDDRICRDVMEYLKKLDVRVPSEMKLASFYYSSLLDNLDTPITAIKYDPRELGVEACKRLIEMARGMEVNPRTLLGYEVSISASTK